MTDSHRVKCLLACAGFVLVSFVSGCAGIVAGSNSNSQVQNPQTYTISGAITPVTGGSGATVKLTGSANATVTADASGSFIFTGLANGTYTLTPSHAGYSFSPASLNVTISGASVTTGVNFTATAQTQTYSISGTISPVAGGSGAAVTLSGAAGGTVTADGSGNFSFTGIANGTYTVTPSRAGYSFSPASLSVMVNGANVGSVNFAATAQTYSISGTISPVTGGAGASVTLSGAANATAVADSSGVFVFTGLLNGGYTITPSHAGYTFSPASQSVTISGLNLNGVNFTATVVGATYSISGTISPTAGGSGATVTLSGAATGTTTADGSGNYTFSGLPNGAYAVTPNHAGYTFSPTSASATVSGANVTGVNFAATATYSISGTISPTAGGAGATVTLSGAANATTLANGSGSYTFTGLANGSYTITPSEAGYTFTPSSQNATVNSANVSGINFSGTAISFTVALTWNASTSTVSGYNIYRSTVNGTAFTKINPSLVTTLTYTDASVVNGTTYYYVTTAVDSSGNESVDSNQVSAAIP